MICIKYLKEILATTLPKCSTQNHLQKTKFMSHDHFFKWITRLKEDRVSETGMHAKWLSHVRLCNPVDCFVLGQTNQDSNLSLTK